MLQSVFCRLDELLLKFEDDMLKDVIVQGFVEIVLHIRMPTVL